MGMAVGGIDIGIGKSERPRQGLAFGLDDITGQAELLAADALAQGPAIEGVAHRGAVADRVFNPLNGVIGQAAFLQQRHRYARRATQRAMTGGMILGDLDLGRAGAKLTQARAQAVAQPVTAGNAAIGDDGGLDRAGAQAVCVEQAGDCGVGGEAGDGDAGAGDGRARRKPRRRLAQFACERGKGSGQGIQIGIRTEAGRLGSQLAAGFAQAQRHKPADRGHDPARLGAVIGEARGAEQGANPGQIERSRRGGRFGTADDQGAGPDPDRIAQQIGAETDIRIEEGGQIDVDNRTARIGTGLEGKGGRAEAPDRAGNAVAEIAGAHAVASAAKAPFLIGFDRPAKRWWQVQDLVGCDLWRRLQGRQRVFGDALACQGQRALDGFFSDTVTQGGAHGTGEGGIATRIETLLALAGTAVAGLGNGIKAFAGDARADFDHAVAQCALGDAAQLCRRFSAVGFDHDRLCRGGRVGHGEAIGPVNAAIAPKVGVGNDIAAEQAGGEFGVENARIIRTVEPAMAGNRPGQRAGEAGDDGVDTALRCDIAALGDLW